MKIRSSCNRIITGMLLFACALVMPGAAATHLDSAQAAPSSQDLSQVNDKLKRTRQVIEESRVKEKELTQRTRELDQKIVGLEEELDGLGAKLEEATQERLSAEERLDQLSSRLARVQRRLRAAESAVIRTGEILNTRLVQMYKAGDADYLSVLLGSNDFNDFVARMSFLQMISSHDRLILSEKMTSRDDVRRLEELVTSNKAEARAEAQLVTANQQRIESIHEQTASRQDALEDEKGSKKVLLDKVVEGRKDAEELEDHLEEESASIQAWLAAQSSGPSLAVSRSGFIIPVSGRISSEFGYRIHPVTGKRRLHAGMDIAAPGGTPIHAAKSGRVIFSGWYGGYGQAVIIDHGGNVATLYAHSSRLLVSVGQSVRRGHSIALVGTTGLSTGNHLHWEVRAYGVPRNPRQFL